MQRLVGRIGAGRLGVPPQLLELLAGESRKTAPVGDREFARRLFEAVEEREIACAAERLQQRPPCRTAFPGERGKEPVGGASLGLVEPRDLLAQVFEDDVEIADRAEDAAEPLQLGAERLGALGIDEPAACPQ